MKKFIVSLLIMSFSFLSPIVMATTEEVRKLCIEKTVARCVERCQKTNTINCSTVCQNTAQNQCRSAGE
ncbi:hypothetical protein [Legionella fallonii]|uniref:hypothetical protein n=1 Tax=Legionella fallonii TaxID=96230 RepID=UPI0005D3F0FD|nr:hypothetical protein [Legionella fallonii]